jgi:hypothetical protein
MIFIVTGWRLRYQRQVPYPVLFALDMPIVQAKLVLSDHRLEMETETLSIYES